MSSHSNYHRRLARELAQREGITYRAALRRIRAQAPRPSTSAPARTDAGVPVDPRPESALLWPGTVTAVISGGGMTNLALVIGEMLALHRGGYSVFVVEHERRGGLLSLPSPLDFVTAGGVADVEEVARLLVKDEHQRLAALIREATDRMRVAGGPMSEVRWRRELSAANRAPVLFVQDVQEDGPLLERTRPPAGIERYEFDVEVAQTAGLKELAHDTGAIVVVGHCAPANYEPGWPDVAAAADHALVVHAEPVIGVDRRPRKAEILHLHNGAQRTFRATIDTRFCDWREALYPTASTG